MKQISTILILSIVLLAATTPAVNAWEERLEECRSFGIAEKDCPDDNTPLIRPTPIEERSTARSSSGTTRTSRVWVWTPPIVIKGENMCYTAYYRININHNNGRVTSTNYRNTTMTGCVRAGEHPINLVRE